MYGTMSKVRAGIVWQSFWLLSKAITIAVRYSAVRRQNHLKPGCVWLVRKKNLIILASGPYPLSYLFFLTPPTLTLLLYTCRLIIIGPMPVGHLLNETVILSWFYFSLNFGD